MHLHSSNLFYYHKSIPSFVIHGFTTKHFGDGKPSGSIIRLFDHLKLSRPISFEHSQSHGTNVVAITSKTDFKITSFADVDGFVTNQANVCLLVRTADCVPIIFVDPKAHSIGVSHQGWKGTIARLPAKIIHEMVSLGADVRSIRALIGPSISVSSYSVSPGFEDQFIQEFSTLSIVHYNRNVPFLNLALMNQITLTEAGLSPGNIVMPLDCTYTHSAFYSHRNGDKERFLTFVMIRD